MTDKPRPKIVVAEDDANLLCLLEVYLRNQGYDVYGAPDGKEALRLVEQEHPQLLISDVMMPHLNGYQLINTLASERHDLPLPRIILLTARIGDDDIRRGLKIGADVYIPKPFHLEEVSVHVKRLLAETPAQPIP